MLKLYQQLKDMFSIWFSSIFFVDLNEILWMSGEKFSAICWSSLLFDIFIIKKWVEFSLPNLKYDCVKKNKRNL